MRWVRVLVAAGYYVSLNGSDAGNGSITSPFRSLLRSEVNSEVNFSPNFEGLVLGCIDADFCK